ncbi:MAG: outer membrane lipoprotein carrier protein LolA [Prevotellaceae bacterium]|jgi:outer membrane lipoprotein-sorting protein|nr:outer membrane lipoprotein carrier protein LolA [Prevotellaceae bacterium]
MKKNLTALILLFLSINFVAAQSDARKILDEMTKKINSYTSVSIDFSIVHEDNQNQTISNENGRITAKGKDFCKFKITMPDSEIYCDGKTKWLYMKTVDEINITLADFDSEEMSDNPVKFFTVDRKDMKYSYKKTFTENQKQLNEIDFYPKDRNAAYSIIRLHIEKSTNHPLSIKYFGKDGNNYTINVDKITPNLIIDDRIFDFDTAKYPDAEIVDLR